VYQGHRSIWKGVKLQRLFTAFPDGWAGVALLLLRVVVGFTLVFAGVAYLKDWNDLTFNTLAIGALCLASGTCLVAGLLTPLACILTVLGSFGLAFSWLPLPPHFVLTGNLVLVNIISMAIVTAVLGPGAFSLDSRMFGRREIVIPPSVRAASTENQKQKF